MRDGERLRERIEKQAQRIERAERERRTLLAQTVFLGTLALLFLVPVVCGAYLGQWIDERQPGYSYGWTMGCLAAGLAVGAFNVYLYLRRN